MSKKIIKKIIDKSGFTIYKNSNLQIGCDYRKNIRNLFGVDSVKTVFDVGANIGQFALHCNEIFNNAIIYSFEPVNTTFEELTLRTKNIKEINCYNFALGESVGKLNIFLAERSVVNSLHNTAQQFINQSSQIVEISTVDKFCKIYNIDNLDLLKIDTEGFEINVLKGASEMLLNKKIKFIFLEVTFDAKNSHNSQFDIIYQYLNSFNYKLFGLYNQSIHDNSAYMNYCDALFVLQNSI